MAADELRLDIKKMILEVLKIEGVQPEQVADDSSIFEDPLLDLDSLDALELVMGLQKRYKVAINDQNLARAILHSVNTIAEFIEKEQGETVDG